MLTEHFAWVSTRLGSGQEEPSVFPRSQRDILNSKMFTPAFGESHGQKDNVRSRVFSWLLPPRGWSTVSGTAWKAEVEPGASFLGKLFAAILKAVSHWAHSSGNPPGGAFEDGSEMDGSSIYFGTKAKKVSRTRKREHTGCFVPPVSSSNVL